MSPVDRSTRIDDLDLHDHVCWMYASDDEHRAGLTAHLTDGLARHERVLYLGASAWLWWRRYT